MVNKIDRMREELQNKTKYKYSEKWHDRVAKMPDNQVAAIYFRMRSAGQIET